MKLSHCVALALLACSCASTANRQPRTKASLKAPAQSIHFGLDSDESICGEVLVGVRNLRSDGLDRVDTQLVTGCRFSAIDKETGFGFEVGIQGSAEDRATPDDGDDDRAFSSSLNEFYLGFFTMLGGASEGLHPYVGVGFSFLETRTDLFADNEGDEEDVSVIGAYADLGLSLISEEGFRVSIDWRTMRGSDTGAFVDADYDQLALVIGVSF